MSHGAIQKIKVASFLEHSVYLCGLGLYYCWRNFSYISQQSSNAFACRQVLDKCYMVQINNVKNFISNITLASLRTLIFHEQLCGSLKQEIRANAHETRESL